MEVEKMTRQFTIKETKKEIKDYLLNYCDEIDVIVLYNEMLQDYNDFDSMVYSNDELDELLNGYTPDEIVRMIFYGDYNYSDNYVYFNGYGNLETFNCVTFRDYPNGGYKWNDSSPLDLNDLINYIIESKQTWDYTVNQIDTDEINF